MLRIDWRKEGHWRVLDGQQARLFREVEVLVPCRLVQEGQHGWLEVSGVVTEDGEKAVITSA